MNPQNHRAISALATLLFVIAGTTATAGPAFTFDRLGDTEGWTAAHAMSEPTIHNGLLRTTITGTDPQLVSADDLKLDAAVCPVLLLRLRCSAEGVGRLFWRGGGAGFAEGRSIGFKLQAAGAFHTYTLQLARDPGWQGTVDQLRLDITDGGDPKANVAINWIALAESDTAIPEPACELLTLDNGTLRLGLDCGAGGAITWISRSGTTDNIINNHDRGRQVQQSYYAGKPLDRKAEGQKENWSPWPWNPIQVGDAWGYTAKILDYKVSDNEIYVKTLPMLWDMKNEPGECFFETWASLHDNTAHVKNRLTCHRTDDRWPEVECSQELPSVYTIGTLYHIFTYEGDKPFTKGELSERPHGFPWNGWNATEHWAALVNDDHWGLGVYNAKADHIIGGFAGKPGAGGPEDAPTGYLSPIRRATLAKDTVFEYEYDLIVGSLDDIRAWVYAHHD